MRYEADDFENGAQDAEPNYTYFYPTLNNYVLQFPMVLRNERNVDEIIRFLENDEFFNYVRNARPTSRWKPVLITQIRSSQFNLK